MLISQCVRDSRCPFTERERQPENQKCNNNNNNNNGWKIVKNKGTLKVYNKWRRAALNVWELVVAVVRDCA